MLKTAAETLFRAARLQTHLPKPGTVTCIRQVTIEITLSTSNKIKWELGVKYQHFLWKFKGPNGILWSRNYISCKSMTLQKQSEQDNLPLTSRGNIDDGAPSLLHLPGVVWGGGGCQVHGRGGVRAKVY